jgi:hypothetical protein
LNDRYHPRRTAVVPPGDFETATVLQRQHHREITKKGYRLIRPPRRDFIFSYIHGISWADVEAQLTFNEVWDHFASFFEKCGLFSSAQCPIRPKCPDGLLFGSRSKTAEGAVHMHRPSRSVTLEFSTGKPANRMYSVRNIPETP